MVKSSRAQEESKYILKNKKMEIFQVNNIGIGYLYRHQ